MRIIQLSDIHIWRYSYNPLQIFTKRVVGTASLIAGRAKRFRLERLQEVVDRVRSLGADHILITGDLTTTALRAEFDEAREALSPRRKCTLGFVFSTRTRRFLASTRLDRISQRGGNFRATSWPGPGSFYSI